VLIGISAILVPYQLSWGRIFLEKLDTGNSFSVGGYYLAAAVWIGLSLVPWCACMGATFPFAMAAIKETIAGESERSFSYLYLANVLGAMTGSALPLLLIEKLGFRGTLYVGAVLNVCLASTAFVLSFKKIAAARMSKIDESPARSAPAPQVVKWPYFLLFATGFTSMAVEVVWIRLFTPALGTVVYAFATILGLYLAATYLGSWYYRRSKSCGDGPNGILLAWLGLSVLLPLLVCDPRLPLVYPLRIVAILPFSFIVGFITPMILDNVSLGDPERAGKGYAINIVGCVLGPLASGFFLLPLLGERGTLLAFALPWIALSFRKWTTGQTSDGRTVSPIAWKQGLAALLAFVFAFGTKSFESQFVPRKVLHDATATVTALLRFEIDLGGRLKPRPTSPAHPLLLRLAVLEENSSRSRGSDAVQWFALASLARLRHLSFGALLLFAQWHTYILPAQPSAGWNVS
jgi:spermidine synthase